MSDDITIRQVRPADLDACCAVETAAFPADEAASPDRVRQRLDAYPQGFLVAERAGRLIGLVMSGATHQPDLADEALKDMVDHDPQGAHLVVFSVAVHPLEQGRGLGGLLVEAILTRAFDHLGKTSVLLLCKETLVAFYQRYGFVEVGPSASTHGGARWIEMRRDRS